MSLMDLAVVALAAALLVYVTGLNRHPRVQGLLAVVYSSAALLADRVALGWNFLIYALATGFVAILLARLGRWGTEQNESREIGVSNLRRRVPRL